MVGGLRIDDPGLDLGVAAALFSSRTDKILDTDTVYVGELGLGGEVRPVAFIDQRIQEVAKMGFKRMVLPAANIADFSGKKQPSLTLQKVRRIDEIFKK